MHILSYSFVLVLALEHGDAEACFFCSVYYLGPISVSVYLSRLCTIAYREHMYGEHAVNGRCGCGPTWQGGKRNERTDERRPTRIDLQHARVRVRIGNSVQARSYTRDLVEIRSPSRIRSSTTASAQHKLCHVRSALHHAHHKLCIRAEGGDATRLAASSATHISVLWHAMVGTTSQPPGRWASIHAHNQGKSNESTESSLPGRRIINGDALIFVRHGSA